VPQHALVDEGRAALRRGDGESARAAFLAALEHERSGAVLDGLGHATCLLRELDDAMVWWHAAYAAYLDEGNGVGAARVARNVASLHGSYAGDWAVASGWVALTSGMFDPDRRCSRCWSRRTCRWARSRRLAAACAADRPEVALAEARAAYDAFERLRAAGWSTPLRRCCARWASRSPAVHRRGSSSPAASRRSSP